MDRNQEGGAPEKGTPRKTDRDIGHAKIDDRPQAGAPRWKISQWKISQWGIPKRGTLKRALWASVTTVLLFGGCCVVSERLVTAADRRAPRDPETGYLLGAEVRELGPQDAPGAALLVHGFIGTGNNFGELPERIAEKGWRVRLMSLPGHGTTPRDFVDVTPDQLLEAVRDEATALRERYGTVVLVGHSMGGALSTLVASEGGADGLVLAAPYFGVTHRWYYILHPEVWFTVIRPFLPRWFYKGDLFMQVNRKEAKPQIVTYKWVRVESTETLLEVGRRARAPERLLTVACPVLLIHSRGDVAASFEASQRAFEVIGSDEKRAVWLTESNHHLFWDYERERVIENVREFLDTVSPERASVPR